jgi:hypothetical protein
VAGRRDPVVDGNYLVIEAFSDPRGRKADDLPQRRDDVLVSGDLKCARERDALVRDRGASPAGVARRHIREDRVRELQARDLGDAQRAVMQVQGTAERVAEILASVAGVVVRTDRIQLRPRLGGLITEYQQPA